MRVVLDADSLPILPGVSRFCAAKGIDSLDFVLGAGEDYELLFAAPRQVMDTVIDVMKPAPTIIGEIITGKPGEITIFDAAGKPITVDSRGWDHYKRAPSNG